MNYIDKYLNEMSVQLKCEETMKAELVEEFRDHLSELKQDYLSKGLSEEIAEKCAVYDFGDYKLYQRSLEEAIHPLQKMFGMSLWVVFFLYILVVAKVLVIGHYDYLLSESSPGRIVLAFNWGTYDFYNLFPFYNMDSEIYRSLFWVSSMNAFNLTFFSTAIGVGLLFIPLGMFLPVLFRKNRLVNIVVRTLVVGMSIEVFQYLTKTGLMNVNDLIYYTAGSAVGWYIHNTLKKFTFSKLKKVLI